MKKNQKKNKKNKYKRQCRFGTECRNMRKCKYYHSQEDFLVVQKKIEIWKNEENYPT